MCSNYSRIPANSHLLLASRTQKLRGDPLGRDPPELPPRTTAKRRCQPRTSGHEFVGYFRNPRRGDRGAQYRSAHAPEL